MESDYLKKFLIKLCDSLFHLHGSSFKKLENTDLFFQVKIPGFNHVRAEIEFFWPNLRSRELCLEIVSETEGCLPLLLEKWRFSLSESRKGKRNYFSDSQALRAFMAFAQMSPSFKYQNKIIYIRDSSLALSWPSLKPGKLLQFPLEPYQVVSLDSALSVSVQYYRKQVKPTICVQDFGPRPRLFSVGSELIPVIHQRKSSCADLADKSLNVISSQSLYEENEVGIKLISSEIYEDSSFEKDSFGRSSFDMEIEIQSDTPEEAKTSLYMLNCDKIRELSLFPSIDCAIKDLVNEWRNVK
jgi:hypothetical protein